MATELFVPGIQDIQIGVIPENVSVMGFKFIPTDVYLCLMLGNFCWITNPDKRETEHCQQNRQLYIKKGSKGIELPTDVEDDPIVCVELTEDGLLRFTDENGKIIIYPNDCNLEYIAIRTEFGEEKDLGTQVLKTRYKKN